MISIFLFFKFEDYIYQVEEQETFIKDILAKDDVFINKLEKIKKIPDFNNDFQLKLYEKYENKKFNESKLLYPKSQNKKIHSRINSMSPKYNTPVNKNNYFLFSDNFKGFFFLNKILKKKKNSLIFLFSSNFR